jgi:hypothetical protein
MEFESNFGAVEVLREGEDPFCAIDKDPESTVVLFSLVGLHEDAGGGEGPVDYKIDVAELPVVVDD